MKKLSLLLMAALFASAAYADNHDPVVTNVHAQQRAGTKLVDITYDVADADGDTLTIIVQLSADSGKTFTIGAVALTGAAGAGIRPGTSKSIVWDAGADYSNQYGTGFQVKVIAIEGGTANDVDGNVYHTVIIGNQVWMVENLKVTHYRDGTSIPNVTGNTEWAGLSTGAYCMYDNNAGNAKTYGHLYNWYAVGDDHGLAPEGWRVPTDEDWQTLEDYLGGESDAGGKLKESGTSHWQSPNTGATNESGFTALPAGYRIDSTGEYDIIGYTVNFWTSTRYVSHSAWCRGLFSNGSNVYRYYAEREFGFSVRCVRDK